MIEIAWMARKLLYCVSRFIILREILLERISQINMQEIDQRSLGMQGIGLFSSFAPWELEQMPSSFQKAAQRAEHNELVRKRLHILQQPKHTILSGADGSHANKCRQKSAKSGRIGPSDYEHLVLKPLARIDVSSIRRLYACCGYCI